MFLRELLLTDSGSSTRLATVAPSLRLRITSSDGSARSTTRGECVVTTAFVPEDLNALIASSRSFRWREFSSSSTRSSEGLVSSRWNRASAFR